MSEHTVLLELMKVAAQQNLPQGLQRPKARVEELIPGQLVAQLTAYVLTEHLANDTETSTRRIPDTWWDHAKADLVDWARDHRLAYRLVTRWLTRHPVKTRAIEFSVTWHRAATRPHSTLQLQELGPVIYQERTERAWFE